MRNLFVGHFLRSLGNTGAHSLQGPEPIRSGSAPHFEGEPVATTSNYQCF